MTTPRRILAPIRVRVSVSITDSVSITVSVRFRVRVRVRFILGFRVQPLSLSMYSGLSLRAGVGLETG